MLRISQTNQHHSIHVCWWSFVRWFSWNSHDAFKLHWYESVKWVRASSKGIKMTGLLPSDSWLIYFSNYESEILVEKKAIFTIIFWELLRTLFSNSYNTSKIFWLTYELANLGGVYKTPDLVWKTAVRLPVIRWANREIIFNSKSDSML